MTCVNSGCNKDVPLRTLAKHQEEECPFRDVVCNFCNKAIKWADQAVSKYWKLHLESSN